MIKNIVITSKNSDQQVLLTVVSINLFIPDINGYNHFSTTLQGEEYIFVLSICGPMIEAYDLEKRSLLLQVNKRI